MLNYSSPSSVAAYQENYRKIQGSFNPYTANLRHPSQEYVYLPDAQPLQEDYNSTVLIHGGGISTSSMTSSSEISSSESLDSRYIVPEVVQPTYESSSEVDTRSVGNPYEHHPNFAEPNKYFSDLVKDSIVKELSDPNSPNAVYGQTEQEQLLTIAEIENLDDPFSKGWVSNAYPVAVNPPNDVTLNKNLMSTMSSEDITRLDVEFPLKGFPFYLANVDRREFSTQTLNKKMFSSESMYDLQKINVEFEKKDVEDLTPTNNLVKLRDFSADSLDDLRNLRNLSAYSDFHELHNVPTSDDILEFQYTENVQYGGM